MNKADRVVMLIRVLFWFQLHHNFDNCAIIDFDGGIFLLPLNGLGVVLAESPACSLSRNRRTSRRQFWRTWGTKCRRRFRQLSGKRGRCWGCPPLNYNECSKYLDLIQFILPNPWPQMVSAGGVPYQKPKRTRPSPFSRPNHIFKCLCFHRQLAVLLTHLKVRYIRHQPIVHKRIASNIKGVKHLPFAQLFSFFLGEGIKFETFTILENTCLSKT